MKINLFWGYRDARIQGYKQEYIDESSDLMMKMKMSDGDGDGDDDSDDDDDGEVRSALGKFVGLGRQARRQSCTAKQNIRPRPSYPSQAVRYLHLELLLHEHERR